MPNETVHVLVPVEPIAWIVEQIGGNNVQVSVLVPAGKTPETFSPTARQFADWADCQIFFRVGLTTENTVLKKLVSIAPNLQSIDLKEGIAPLSEHTVHDELAEHDEHSENVHSEAESLEHEHLTSNQSLVDENETANSGEKTAEHQCSEDGLDPHIWMSPDSVLTMIPQIVRHLSEKNPGKKDSFEKNAKLLTEKIQKLQQDIQKQLQPFESRNIYVFHPAYGHFCREFHLNQCPIEIDGKAPKPQALAELIENAKRENVQIILVQPEFGQSAAETVAESIQAQIVIHSPLEKDYIKNLNSLTHSIVQSFATEK